MDPFFPFIHKIEKKEEFQPLYIELEPPPLHQKKEEKPDNPNIIIIEL